MSRINQIKTDIVHDTPTFCVQSLHGFYVDFAKKKKQKFINTQQSGDVIWQTILNITVNFLTAVKLRSV